MKYLKAFVAGIALPSVILPIGLLSLSALGKEQILSMPAIHLVPLLWGIWNVLYFVFFKWVLYVLGKSGRLYVTGALLGFLVAAIAIFWFHVPEKLQVPTYLTYMPLIAAPILYAVLWRYGVEFLNELVGLRD